MQKVKTKKKILFILHDSSRTGAPMVMLIFLEWLKMQDVFDFEILLKKTGPLEDELEKIAIVHTKQKNTLVRRILNRAKSELKIAKNYTLPLSLIGKKFDLVYMNTIDSLDQTSELYKLFNCPIICHVHENDFTIKVHYPNYLNKDNTQFISKFIAVSKSTRDNLVEEYDISPDKISLVYEPIRLDKIKSISLRPQFIKDELHIKDEFVVGGSGLSTWRKGIDLFIQLAVELNREEPDNKIKLVWVGNVDNDFKVQYEYEEERLGIKNKIIFTGVKSDVQNYFQVFDVFTLTSREDPFPLVVLEAASQSKPIILFDQSGGMPELFENNKGGVIVPYADVNAMAKSILMLQKQRNKLKQLGAEAESMVKQFDIPIIGKQLVDVIESVLK